MQEEITEEGGVLLPVARADVDAVYLPLPTGLRTEWAVRAAEAGKHVLVEKPCAPTVADLETILAAWQGSGVQFMPMPQPTETPVTSP